jgi:hypothetical protein
MASPSAINGRPPIRSERLPAIGAMNIGIAVQGRVRRPASSGEYPCTVWRNWESRKIEPNMPKNMNSEAAFEAANVRFRKKRTGSIGAGVRRSQSTKAAVSAMPKPSAVRTSGDVQPCPFPRTTPQTIPNSPALTSARPWRSREE